MSENIGQPDIQNASVSRRKFLTYAGVVAGGSLLGTACKKDSKPAPAQSAEAIDLGFEDIGILNFIYSMEQLETEFFTQVSAKPYDGIASLDKDLFSDIRYHELAHRELLSVMLGDNAIQTLSIDFSDVDFTNKAVVLNLAQQLKDMTLGSYNYVANLLASTEYLSVLSKIISVEARHAAYIRDLNSFGSFAAGVDTNGMDSIVDPWQAVNFANTYFRTKISATNLPTN